MVRMPPPSRFARRGSLARAKALTPKQRAEIARKQQLSDGRNSVALSCVSSPCDTGVEALAATAKFIFHLPRATARHVARVVGRRRSRASVWRGEASMTAAEETGFSAADGERRSSLALEFVQSSDCGLREHPTPLGNAANLSRGRGSGPQLSVLTPFSLGARFLRLGPLVATRRPSDTSPASPERCWSSWLT